MISLVFEDLGMAVAPLMFSYSSDGWLPSLPFEVGVL